MSVHAPHPGNRHELVVVSPQHCIDVGKRHAVSRGLLVLDGGATGGPAACCRENEEESQGAKPGHYGPPTPTMVAPKKLSTSPMGFAIAMKRLPA